jgi:hypothetical protein
VTLLMVLALLLTLDLAAWWWGRDSRDGLDWRPCGQRRSVLVPKEE